MRVFTSKKFDKDYAKLPTKIKKTLDQKIGLFITNPHHPSFQTKKMQGKEDVWEARITQSYRLTFHIEKDRYTLRRIGTHAILKTP